MPKTDRRVRLGGAIAAATFTGAAEQAGAGRPTTRTLDPARLKSIEALLEALVSSGKLAGASAQVAQHGRKVYEAVVGLADISDGRPLRRDAVFRIYSMSKPVTACAVALLAEDGALKLSDPVTRFVPEFAEMTVYVGGEGEDLRTEPARPMTILDLLTHTSGISNSWNPGPIAPLYLKAGLRAGVYIHDPAIKGLPDVARRMADVPLTFQPGTRWLYSFAPDIAGLVVERASKMSFGAFLKRRIFDPLGMADTGFYVRPEAAPRLAASYAAPGGRLTLVDGAQASPFLNPPSAESGAAGLVSSLDDYGRFAAMLAGLGKLGETRVMSEATARLMMSSHVSQDILGDTLDRFMAFGGGGTGGGLGQALGGVVITDAAASKSGGEVGEYGWGGAASTTFFSTPSLGLSAVLMTQLTPSGLLPLRDQLKAAVYGALV
jgi:CubicO group peptidase (beta-lactamase class C family)